MKGPKYISIVLWVALLGSILLNVGLLYRLNGFRKASIDLRHVSVSVSSDPPEILDVKSQFEKGDKVRIREGAFANYEGEVKMIIDTKEAGETPKVTVEVQVLGRPVPIELEYWQVDKI
jgi:hypothetical protein